MREISIRNWREPIEQKKGIALIFDIFRCSTTISCILSYRETNIWVTKNLDAIKSQAHNFKIFSELEENIQCNTRYDNSPAQALYPENSSDDEHPMLVSTTSGTPAIFAARGFEEVWVVALTNFSATVRALENETRSITLFPAAAPESDHVEDGLVAQYLATALDGYANDPEFVKGCAEKSIESILQSGRKEYLEKKLPTGIPDLRIALHLDRYNFLAKINFQTKTNIPGLARVEKKSI